MELYILRPIFIIYGIILLALCSSAHLRVYLKKERDQTPYPHFFVFVCNIIEYLIELFVIYEIVLLCLKFTAN